MSTLSLGEPRLLWAAGAELGEGPLWDDREGWIYWLDIEGRYLHRADAAGARRRSWRMPKHIGLAALTDCPGLLLLGLTSGIYLFQPNTAPEDAAQGLRFLLRPAGLKTDARPNDGKVDVAGRLWFGSMAFSQHEGGGALHRLDPDGRCHCLVEGWTIPNGPAIAPDGRRLYWADSHRRSIFTLELGESDRPAEPQLFLHLPESDAGVPDGLAFDAEGCLWVAMNGGGCVRRFGSDGTAFGEIALPAPAVSACAFGGADLRTLFVTTARPASGIPRGGAASGALFAAPAGVPGLPANRFASQALLRNSGQQEGKALCEAASCTRTTGCACTWPCWKRAMLSPTV